MAVHLATPHIYVRNAKHNVRPYINSVNHET